MMNEGKEYCMLYWLSQSYTHMFAYGNTTSVHCLIAGHTMCLLLLGKELYNREERSVTSCYFGSKISGSQQ